MAEAFADRAYTPDGALVSRREPGSVLHDADEVAARMVTLVRTGTVPAVDGSAVAVAGASRSASTATPRAPSRWPGPCATALVEAGIGVRSFAAGPQAG